MDNISNEKAQIVKYLDEFQRQQKQNAGTSKLISNIRQSCNTIQVGIDAETNRMTGVQTTLDKQKRTKEQLTRDYKYLQSQYEKINKSLQVIKRENLELRWDLNHYIEENLKWESNFSKFIQTCFQKINALTVDLTQAYINRDEQDQETLIQTFEQITYLFGSQTRQNAKKLISASKLQQIAYYYDFYELGQLQHYPEYNQYYQHNIEGDQEDFYEQSMKK